MVWDPVVGRYLAFGTLKSAALGELSTWNTCDLSIDLQKIISMMKPPRAHVVSAQYLSSPAFD